ncbi:MAG: SoxY-related AACIE arm protein [Burkholderiales bacterium]
MTSRREFLGLACGAASFAAATTVTAQIDPNQQALRKAAMQDSLRRVVGDATVRSGRVKLELPPLVDNGNAVPLAVTVESPMTSANHVKAIHVFTERNPQPDVMSVHLGPRAGRAGITTRIRIADTQTVTAIAQLSDGTFWSGSAEVIVTLSACLEEGLI